ncbi:MAG: molybdopterin-synthase adenylyltransferase MoeB [Bacteroidetes bacterium]|nr:MAG: molybdopterin-synthase adenylyltransferase MoeB [Bacteroidota bacterium]
MNRSLSSEELVRYQRHLSLEEIGTEGQLKLKKAKVLVVGAGGLGCPVLQYLTAAGVGNIGIIDFDKVEASNLQRQILFSTNDTGKNKAEIATKHLEKLNPFVKFNIYKEKLTAANVLSVFKPYDLIIDGTDNFSTRYLINDAAVILKKPFVYGSIFRFEGQVSVFNYKNGPTYRCLFPEPPNPGETPSCSEAGVLGALPGIIGSYQALEAIKIITGTGQVLSGKLLMINTLHNSFQIIEVKRNPEMISQIKTIKPFPEENLCFSNSIEEITEIEFQELVKSQHVLFIDVRNPGEQPQLKVAQNINIPLDTFRENIKKIPRNKTLVVYCQTGVRSRKAVEILTDEFGYENVKTLKGGVLNCSSVF